MAVGIDDGPYRLRGASDVAWPSQGYGQRTGISQRVADAFRAVVRMVLPVLGLCAALAAMYLYMDSALPYFADRSGRWLTVSDLILPAAFLALHLTNRRYGPAYAFAQTVISFAVLAGVTIFAGDIVRHLLPQAIVPSVRVVTAFGIAFFIAGFVGIVAFDGMRGPRWWTAPLIGSIVTSLIYAPIFYMAAYVGTQTPWLNHMAIHAGLLLGGAVLSLVPYWLLRRIVQPLPGFGGY
ncbi:MAG: VUT family protein [Alphaproteobacteria bacterium]|nr:VUT family protein [Alphaproteobacteria bacterium]